MFTEAIERILDDHCTSAAIRGIEARGETDALWFALADPGFLELMTPEERDGGGMPLVELFDVARLAGRYAVPVPIAHSIAARALLADHADAVPQGMISFAPRVKRSGDELCCAEVAFGTVADHVLVADGDRLLILDARLAQRGEGASANALTCSLRWQCDRAAVSIAALGEQILSFGAALHSALLVGAMERVLEMSLTFCNDRFQFGKPIGKLQAIQHQLAVMAEHVTAAGFAAAAAFPERAALPPMIGTAIAKSRTSEAAILVSEIAHGVHGAIGVTEEFDLQLYTRRLHAWRMADGSETYWQGQLGAALLACPQKGAVDFVREA